MTEQDAVALLRKNGPMVAMDFARAAWPDSEGWHRPRRCGTRNTSSRGAGMSRPALGMLGRLKKKGLVRARYEERATLWEAT